MWKLSGKCWKLTLWKRSEREEHFGEGKKKKKKDKELGQISDAESRSPLFVAFLIVCYITCLHYWPHFPSPEVAWFHHQLVKPKPLHHLPLSTPSLVFSALTGLYSCMCSKCNKWVFRKDLNYILEQQAFLF